MYISFTIKKKNGVSANFLMSNVCHVWDFLIDLTQSSNEVVLNGDILTLWEELFPICFE